MFNLLGIVVVLAMILTACAPAATPAPTTAPTKAAEPTKAPVATAAAEFKPLKLAAPDCNYGGTMKQIEATDKYTVKFTFCQPEPAFLGKIQMQSFGILDSDYLNTTGGDSSKITPKPIGTGPYVVKDYARGTQIIMEPNPNYWGPKVQNTQFILKWNKEAAARLLELQSGNVDAIDNPGTDDYATIEKDKNLKNNLRTAPNILYMGMNNTIKPFDNEKVRQAFSIGLDKQRIIDNFYPKGSAAAEQAVPPTTKPGYTDGLKWPKYDKAAAIALLKEANFDFAQEITLYYAERTRGYFPQPTKIAQDIQAQYKELGINVKLSVQEWATYLPMVSDGKTGLFLLGWGEDYPDATDWYDVFFLGTSKNFGTPYPDLMENIKKASTTGDPVARQKYYDEVNKLFTTRLPWISIAHAVNALAARADVQGLVIGPYNENFQDWVTKSGKVTFSQNGEPVSLWCADETDGDSFRACDVIYDTLYAFKFGSSEVVPSLADKCTSNADVSEWTCTLRKGVKFSNGAELDAADVFATFTTIWDAKNPNHKGNTGNFQYWADLFGGFLNPAPKK